MRAAEMEDKERNVWERAEVELRQRLAKED